MYYPEGRLLGLDVLRLTEAYKVMGKAHVYFTSTGPPGLGAGYDIEYIPPMMSTNRNRSAGLRSYNIIFGIFPADILSSFVSSSYISGGAIYCLVVRRSFTIVSIAFGGKRVRNKD